jgi:hypothetical protein
MFKRLADGHGRYKGMILLRDYACLPAGRHDALRIAHFALFLPPVYLAEDRFEKYAML